MAEKRKMVDIGALLSDIVENRNWQRNFNLNRIFEFWNDAVGEDIASHAQPNVIRGSVLWVNVTDSIWMQQLHLMKEHLRQVLNDRLGDDGIEDIRFNMASKLKPVLAERKEVVDRLPPLADPDPAALARFEKMLAAIGDENTRASLKRIWLAQHDRG